MQLKSVERKQRKYLQTKGQNTFLRSELEDDCQGLEYMINEIKRSIDAAEKNPSRFKLTKTEVENRKQWMYGVKARTDAILQDLTSTRHGATEMSTASTTGKLTSAMKDENDRFINTEMAQQEVIMRRQDEDLDQLGEHVLRIGELGREMGQELDAQGQILDEMGYEIEGTQTRLAAAQKKVQYVLDRAGPKGQLIIVAILVVLLVILIVLTIS